MVKTLVIVARCRAVVWSVLYAMARKSKADKSGTEKGKSIELEGKRKSDNAWCECQVSLGSAEPSGTFLNVHFASFKNDQTDTIMQEDEVMARLRVRSTSLSDGECLQVKEGEAIVALLKSQSGRCHFFDAQVEKVQRVKHSNKVFCRCTFEIKWLEGKMKGETVTVPASSIRRLVHENINNHPVISAFFKAVQAANMPSMSLQLPSSLPHEDSDIESDLHDRLEQQIEEIAKLADNSENAATEEMPSRRTTVNVNKRHRGNVPTSHDITVYNKNANEKSVSRTSARKRNRVSSETVCKDAVTVRAATLLHSEKRPRLSPLAARAALAAAVWNLPLGKQNFVAKKQDSVDQSDRNAFRKQLDKVSLKLSDTYFDIRSQGNYKGLRKRAASSARGKSPKRPRASNFHEHPDNAFKANRGEHDGAYKKHLRNASADRSVVGTPQLISVSTKQETSSDIASTVKGPSSTAGVAVSLTKKMIQKRHKGTSKEVSSTRSRKRSAGVMPVRSSPRFQSSSHQLECNKQQPLLSQENTDSGKKESVVTENVQREQSGRSSTARVKSRMPIKGKKQLKASANEPELATVSADSLEAKHPLNGDNNETFSEAIEGSTQHNGCKKAFKAASVESKEVKHSSIFTEQSSQQGKVPQGKAYNTAGKASKAALIGAKKGKHLLKGAIAENITEVVRKRPKENGISDDKKASHASLVEPKNQLEEVPSLDHMTSNSTEISLEATKKRTQNEPGSKKMDSKATTSISRKPKKTVTSTRRENSNGMDKAEHQPLNRKRTSRVTCSHEGEYSRKVGTHLYKSLQAQPRSIMREEKKHASRKSVVRSSPRLRFLPRTRSQKNTTGGHQWALGM